MRELVSVAAEGGAEGEPHVGQRGSDAETRATTVQNEHVLSHVAAPEPGAEPEPLEPPSGAPPVDPRDPPRLPVCTAVGGRPVRAGGREAEEDVDLPDGVLSTLPSPPLPLTPPLFFSSSCQATSDDSETHGATA